MSAARFGSHLFGLWSLAQEPSPMAQHLRNPRGWRAICGRGKPVGRLLFLHPDCGGLLYPTPEADQSFGNCPEQPVAHDLFRLLLYFRFLVGLSFRRFQAVDQSSWSSDHGAHRSYGTVSRRSAEKIDEKMCLCDRSCLDFVY